MQLTGTNEIVPLERVQLFSTFLKSIGKRRLGNFELNFDDNGYELIVDDQTSDLRHSYFYDLRGNFRYSYIAHGIAPLVGSREVSTSPTNQKNEGDRYLRQLIWAACAPAVPQPSILKRILLALFFKTPTTRQAVARH